MIVGGFYALCSSLDVRGGGALVFEVGYHPRKQIHVIRIVFQDQVMYTRTSFRGAKTCKIGKKRVYFWSYNKFWKGHDGQIKEKRMQKRVFRVSFPT